LLQAAELNRWANTPSPPPAGRPAIAREPLLECVAILHDVTHRQLQVANWYVPDPNPDTPHVWRPWNHSLLEPEILAALRGATRQPPMNLDRRASSLWRSRPSAALATSGRHSVSRPRAPQIRLSR
jgi:hypothetical protein